MPFSSDQFFQVFQKYNIGVGNSIWFLYGATLLSVYLLSRQHPKANQVGLALLSFLWLWIGLVYHWNYFSQINPAARIFAGFFVVQAMMFAFASWRNWPLRIDPARTPIGLLQWFLIVYALIIYPLIGALSGHGYPNGPIFGLPCPTTIFTFALLSGLHAQLRSVIFLSLIPALWTIIGTSAAKYFGVNEDYMLAVSAVVFASIQFLSALNSLPRRFKPLILGKNRGR